MLKHRVAFTPFKAKIKNPLCKQAVFSSCPLRQEAGKTSLVNAALEADSQLVVSVSHTTRPARGARLTVKITSLSVTTSSCK